MWTLHPLPPRNADPLAPPSKCTRVTSASLLLPVARTITSTVWVTARNRNGNVQCAAIWQSGNRTWRGTSTFTSTTSSNATYVSTRPSDIRTSSDTAKLTININTNKLLRRTACFDIEYLLNVINLYKEWICGCSWQFYMDFCCVVSNSKWHLFKTWSWKFPKLITPILTDHLLLG